MESILLPKARHILWWPICFMCCFAFIACTASLILKMHTWKKDTAVYKNISFTWGSEISSNKRKCHISIYFYSSFTHSWPDLPKLMCVCWCIYYVQTKKYLILTVFYIHPACVRACVRLQCT